MTAEFLCPECGEPFDPSKGVGPYGDGGIKDGVPYQRELGIRMTCGQHSWNCPGRTMMDVMSARPELAPEYIRMTLADQALRRVGL